MTTSSGLPLQALLDYITSVSPASRHDSNSAQGILWLLSQTDDALLGPRNQLLAALKKRASTVLAEQRGLDVYYRGLLEFSNLCVRNCSYCGIQAANKKVERFTLSLEEICQTASWCADNGYGSLTLQSGERRDPAFVDLVEAAIVRIKEVSCRPNLPQGLGITLCVGEQDSQALQRFKKAGAHRYLLRIETSNARLYQELHPASDGSLSDRIDNLRLLKALGFQVGTGVMIGLPGQTALDLVNDLHFFFDERVQMVGMGPYIRHQDTSLGAALLAQQNLATDIANPVLLPDRTRFELGLAMIALTRIMMPKGNVAATTALQALHPFGRELGMEYGANILMPLVTPSRVRESYQLYDNKPCVDDELDECRDCLAARVVRSKRHVAYNQYGDSLIPVQEVIEP